MSAGSSTTPLRDVLARLDDAVARREKIATATAGAARAALDVLLADLDGSNIVEIAEARLTTLAGRAGLAPGEVAALAATLVADLHPLGFLLTGLLAGDDGAARPTVSLVLELAGRSVVDPAALSSLGTGAPLSALGLLELLGDAPTPARRAALPERVAAHLRGDDTPAALARSVTTTAVPVDARGTDEVAHAIAAGEPLTWIESRHGASGTSLVAAACARLDVDLLVADLALLDAGRGPSDAPVDTGPVIEALLLEALLDGRVLVVAGADRATQHLGTLLESPVPVVGVGAGRWDARWTHWLPATIIAPRLTAHERADVWRTALGGAEPAASVTTLRLSPDDIVRVAVRAREDSGEAPDADAQRAAVARLGRTSTPSGVRATLDDLVLPEHARAEVERLVAWGTHRDDVVELGPVHGKSGKASGIAALFSGSPGTGKTLAAHVVADTLGMELLQVDLSAIVDKYVGETEKNLERIFTEAEQLSCVLFIDEADALFGKRSAVGDSRDRYANQEVAYLLQRMETFDGITVLATNLRGNLDPAFARRLQFMVHFPDPDEATRAQLWTHHLAQLPGTDPDDPVDVPLLARRLEVAGGDIRNVVLAATYDSVAAGETLGMRHVVVAAGREMAKLGRRTGSLTAARPGELA